MKPFMIYLVGISGSGKTTIAQALFEELNKSYGNKIEFIDGDVIRNEFGDIFGFTKEERMKCNAAVRTVVRYLLKNNICVILAQVAPYDDMRNKVREDLQKLSVYSEIYVKCSIEECMKRDVKGYYSKCSNNEMKNLNGVNDIFEIPKNSELVLDTEKVSVNESVETIMKYLRGLGYDI